MEAAELGLYLFSACAFSTLFGTLHPRSRTSSPARSLVAPLWDWAWAPPSSPSFFRPGANSPEGISIPQSRLTYYRLGKVEFWDAWFYTAAQFLGAIGGVAVAIYVLRGAPGNVAVGYAVTVPGIYGRAIAFVAELAISFVLMMTVLFLTNRAKVGAVHGLLRRLDDCGIHHLRSAALRNEYEPRADLRFGLPCRLLARTLDLFHRTIPRDVGRRGSFPEIRRGVPPYCAKLHHANNKRCIFRHGQM